MVYISRCLALVLALLAVNGLFAQTVYKSVDEKGNVIYSENPPTKSKDGKIRSTTELSIDPNRNVLPAQPPVNMPSSGQQSAPASGETARADKIAEARVALAAAEAQLKAGNEVQPGDFAGRAGGGVGPSQQRLQRLNELQNAVDEAKQNLERAQGGSD